MICKKEGEEESRGMKEGGSVSVIARGGTFYGM